MHLTTPPPPPAHLVCWPCSWEHGQNQGNFFLSKIGLKLNQKWLTHKTNMKDLKDLQPFKIPHIPYNIATIFLWHWLWTMNWPFWPSSQLVDKFLSYEVPHGISRRIPWGCLTILLANLFKWAFENFDRILGSAMSTGRWWGKAAIRGRLSRQIQISFQT